MIKKGSLLMREHGDQGKHTISIHLLYMYIYDINACLIKVDGH